jgi:SOS-response transcriptional repressor LexA
MSKKHTNVSPDKTDNFLRLWKRVLGDSQLNPLQKIILCDVISYVIEGKRYYKTSKALSKELGNISKRTIQDNFQKLNKMGYLDTVPFKATPDEPLSLREAIVVNLDQWVLSDEEFKSRNLEHFKAVPKESFHPTRMEWPNRHSKKKKPEVAPEPNHSVQQTQENDSEHSLPVVSFDSIGNTFAIRDEIRNLMKLGTEVKFIEVMVDFGENDLMKDVVVKINDSINPQFKYMRKQFIYDDWDQSDKNNDEDELDMGLLHDLEL